MPLLPIEKDFDRPDKEEKYAESTSIAHSTATLSQSKINRIIEGLVYRSIFFTWVGYEQLMDLTSQEYCSCKLINRYSNVLKKEFHEAISSIRSTDINFYTIYTAFQTHLQEFNIDNLLYEKMKIQRSRSQNPLCEQLIMNIISFLQEDLSVTSPQLAEERLELFYYIAEVPVKNLYSTHFRPRCKRSKNCSTLTEIGLRSSIFMQDISLLRQLSPLYTLPSIWKILVPIYNHAVNHIATQRNIKYPIEINRDILIEIDTESKKMITGIERQNKDKICSPAYQLRKKFSGNYVGILGQDTYEKPE